MDDEFENLSEDRKRFAGAGGTSGGVLEFLVGLGLLALGAYLVTARVTVYGGYFGWFGDHTFGITMLPLLFGVGILFFNGRSILGWALAGLGLLVVLAGVLVNLRIAFEPTNLFNTIVIFGLVAAGVGLIARSLRTH